MASSFGSWLEAGYTMNSTRDDACVLFAAGATFKELRQIEPQKAERRIRANRTAAKHPVETVATAASAKVVNGLFSLCMALQLLVQVYSAIQQPFLHFDRSVSPAEIWFISRSQQGNDPARIDCCRCAQGREMLIGAAVCIP